MNIRPVHIGRADEESWNHLLLSSPHASYRQSMPWEYAGQAEGREIVTYLFEQDGCPVAGAHYSLKRSTANLITVADILHGVLFCSQPDTNLYATILMHFEQWAAKHKASYARITPWLPKIFAGNTTDYAGWLPETLHDHGYSAIQPGRHTYWIDLTQSEGELTRRMSKSTRKRIRRSEQMGVRIYTCTQPDEAVVDQFWNLYRREGQQARSYLKAKDRVMKEVIPMLTSRLAFLYFAEYQDAKLYVTLASNFGQAATIHSGMNIDVKDNNQPSPGHLMRWKMISDMKSRGIKIHDMGFCPGPTPIEDHPLYGIWHFKHSFGGDHVEYLPVYGKPLRRISGWLFRELMKRR